MGDFVQRFDSTSPRGFEEAQGVVMSWEFLRALREYFFRSKLSPADGAQIAGRLRELSQPEPKPPSPLETVEKASLAKASDRVLVAAEALRMRSCGRSADVWCAACGTPLCSIYAERCGLCAETFCQSCSIRVSTESLLTRIAIQRGTRKAPDRTGQRTGGTSETSKAVPLMKRAVSLVSRWPMPVLARQSP
jgi:hypothetical protein